MFELMRTALLGIIGIALAIVSVFWVSSENVNAPTETVPARITENVQATSTPELTETASTTPAAEPEKKPAVEVKPQTPVVAVPPVQEVIETITAPIPEPTLPAPSTLNEKVRASVVNVICVTTSGGILNSISASGVIIDPKGVILTNSHVAQYFLLKDYPSPGSIDCYIRTGSPAQPKYTAELLFMPPSWIRDNAQKIDDEAPTGNGEHDYALLRITGTINPNVALPASFLALPLSLDNPGQGQSTLTAGYPAGFLGGITIAKELYQASSVTTVRELYTFDVNTPDLFSVGGSVVAQQGSSGGAVADNAGNLLGIVVTSTNAGDTASRDLRAISLAYIARDFEKESGSTLAAYLSGDLESTARQFALGIAPTLRQTLVNVIEN